MEFFPLSTLATRSAISVVTTLWSCEIEKGIQKDLNVFLQDIGFWREAAKNVITRIMALPIATCTRESLINSAQPIGKEIQNWWNAHEFLNETCKPVPNMLCWNKSQGTINLKQTAKTTLPYVSDNMTSFRLACMYFMEDEILELWPLVEAYFENIVNCNFLIGTSEVVYWIHRCNKNEDVNVFEEEENGLLNLGTAYSYFWQAFSDKKKVAAKYFLDIMDERERHRVIIHTLERKLATEIWRDTSIILLLLSYLDPNEQDEMLMKYPHGISIQFLNWPYQCLFLDTVRKVWGKLHERGCYIILENIIECISEYPESDIYKNILKHYWQECPLNSKRYIMDKCINSTFLVRLAGAEDNDCAIQLIVQSFTSDEKRTMLLSMIGLMVINFLIKRRRWDCLNMFLRKCIPSENPDTWAKKLLNVYYEAKKRTPFLLGIEDSDLNKLTGILQDICGQW